MSPPTAQNAKLFTHSLPYPRNGTAIVLKYSRTRTAKNPSSFCGDHFNVPHKRKSTLAQIQHPMRHTTGPSPLRNAPGFFHRLSYRRAFLDTFRRVRARARPITPGGSPPHVPGPPRAPATSRAWVASNYFLSSASLPPAPQNAPFIRPENPRLRTNGPRFGINGLD